jgi:hypothetical protein
MTCAKQAIANKVSSINKKIVGVNNTLFLKGLFFLVLLKVGLGTNYRLQQKIKLSILTCF